MNPTKSSRTMAVSLPTIIAGLAPVPALDAWLEAQRRKPAPEPVLPAPPTEQLVIPGSDGPALTRQQWRRKLETDAGMPVATTMRRRRLSDPTPGLGSTA
jgi:hypothetical protein